MVKVEISKGNVIFMKLLYDSPASHCDILNAETALLPIGNGFMGALVSGHAHCEKLQINEESLWSGGPGSGQGSTYSFGHAPDSPDVLSPEQLLASMKDGSYTDDLMQGMLGVTNGYGAYQSFCSLSLDYRHCGSVTGYRRELNLETGVVKVCYEVDGICFTREYFASYPAGVIVMKIFADKPGAVNLTLAAQSARNDVQVTYGEAQNGALISLDGKLADNGMRYAARFIVAGDGGNRSSYDDKLVFENADAVTIYISAATDYKNEFLGLETSTYRNGLEPGLSAAERAKKAQSRSYTGLYSEHVADYRALFGRVTLDIGENLDEGASGAHVNELIANYGVSPQNDRTLEVLLFQYGRYLLISSSRPCTLPANLQGKWNVEDEPPWSSDYHYNINLQMNYWPAGVTNLSECTLPLVSFIKSLIPSGEITAQKYNGVSEGWTFHTSGNIFGFTAPGTSLEWGWSPANNAFICQNLWDYFLFTHDVDTLRNQIYPIIKGAALFWKNALVEDGNDLLAVPSLSPEHGPVTYATAYDQQLVWELFDFTIRAIDVLDLADDFKLKEELEDKQKRLSPAEIGAFGQIMEWRDEPSDFDDKYDKEHRHISQLAGLYPGTIITKKTPELLEAARVTLERRGDGATGWSMGWKIALRARVYDGNRAHLLIQNLIRYNIAKNLFGLHAMGPPRNSAFQIDANLGYCAGVAEMLLQSHAGYIDILPALPDVWHTGSVKGLVARGGFIIDMNWSNCKLDTLEITSTTGLPCTIKYGDYTNKLDTVKGKKYVIF